MFHLGSNSIRSECPNSLKLAPKLRFEAPEQGYFPGIITYLDTTLEDLRQLCCFFDFKSSTQGDLKILTR